MSNQLKYEPFHGNSIFKYILLYKTTTENPNYYHLTKNEAPLKDDLIRGNINIVNT